jgi:uncharacterized protein YbjT (DUF2867 family)
MYAIAGVSGNTGSVVATTLLAQGKPVRVIVRDAAKGEPWRARGAEVAVASLHDAVALTAALAGVDGVYLLLPPRMDVADPLANHRALVASLRAAVEAARIPHVVLLSSIGAQHADGTGPIQSVHHAEVELAATGAALTAVRAAYFQENWGASLGMLDQGVLPTFVAPAIAFSMVATADIGRVAAAALIEGGRGTQIIELSGPRELSPDDVAAALTAIVGKPVATHQAPLDAVVPTFTGLGIHAAVATLYREMYAGIGGGRVAWEGGAARAVRGTVTIDTTLRALLKR